MVRKARRWCASLYSVSVRMALLVYQEAFPARAVEPLVLSQFGAHFGLAKRASRPASEFVYIPLNAKTGLLRRKCSADRVHRILVILGHKGTPNGWSGIVRRAESQGLGVDFLVKPGYVHSKLEISWISESVAGVRTALTAGPRYAGVISHCIGGNALLYCMEEGVRAPPRIFVAMPVDISLLIDWFVTRRRLTGRRRQAALRAADKHSGAYRPSRPVRPAAAADGAASLLLHGAQDLTAPMDNTLRFAQAVPGMNTKILSDAGHVDILWNEDAVALIGDFLSKHVATTRCRAPRPSAPAPSAPSSRDRPVFTPRTA